MKSELKIHKGLLYNDMSISLVYHKKVMIVIRATEGETGVPQSQKVPQSNKDSTSFFIQDCLIENINPSCVMQCRIICNNM